MALGPERRARYSMSIKSTHRAPPDRPNDAARRRLVAAIRREVERKVRRRLVWIGSATSAVVLACAGVALFLATELQQERADIRALRMEIADAARQLTDVKGAAERPAEAAGLMQRLTMLRRRLQRLAPDERIGPPVAALVPLTPLIEMMVPLPGPPAGRAVAVAPAWPDGDGGAADSPAVSGLSGGVPPAVAARRARLLSVAGDGPASDMSIRTEPAVQPGRPRAVAPVAARDPERRPPTAGADPSGRAVAPVAPSGMSADPAGTRDRVDPGITVGDAAPGKKPPETEAPPGTLAGQSGLAADDRNGRAAATATTAAANPAPAAATGVAVADATVATGSPSPAAVPAARPTVPETARRLVAAAYRRDADDRDRQAAAKIAKAQAAKRAAQQASVESAALAESAVGPVGRGQLITIVFAPGAEMLQRRLVEAGFNAVIDATRPKGRSRFPGKLVSGIRLSVELPADATTALVAIARAEMPFLRYVYLDSRSTVQGTYIGTLTKRAKEHFYPISDKGFERLSDRTLTRGDLHRIIQWFSRRGRVGLK